MARRHLFARLLLACAASLCASLTAAAQPAAPTEAVAAAPTPAAQPTTPAASAAAPLPAPTAVGAPPLAEEALVSQTEREQFADVWFSNRRIVTFRATIVPRDPAERARGAERRLDALADSGVAGPVSSRVLGSSTVVTVANRDVFAILVEVVDPASSDDLGHLTAQTVTVLQTALLEAAEARTPRRLAVAAAKALVATLLLALFAYALVRMYRWANARLLAAAEGRLARLKVSHDEALVRAARVKELTRGTVALFTGLLAAVGVYLWLAYVLQQFPLTRPWGEALGGFLVDTFSSLGWGVLAAMPGIFTAGVIFLVTRFVVRLSGLLFQAIEEGRIEVEALSGPKALATRRLVSTLLWLFAIIVAYPYLPGSNTEAFKGVSVFVGLVISLGSSGVVNQFMSGFMLTYSGALAPGEYVRIGETEGTVTALSLLSTKVRTRRNEEVTIPNAVVVGGTTVNFSRHATDGVYGETKVTIGYDTPWRQVEAMLVDACRQTAGVRQDRPPIVLQTALSDFYVEYTLLACLDQPHRRGPTLSVLHARIQDVFNANGVQIMSPNYEADPAEPKLVPPERWHVSPRGE